MTPGDAGQPTSRREFLARAAKAGAALAVTAYAGHHFSRQQASVPARRAPRGVTLPDFSIPEAGRRIAIITGSDRAKTVAAGVAAIGGIERFIDKGDRVLLKVNAAFATPPMLSAPTHPELVAEVVRLCHAAGATSVVITDNPINDPVSCFDLTGIAAAARHARAELVVPRAAYFEPTTLPGGELIRDWPLLYKPFAGVTKLIGTAPVKDHHRSGASMTMKNWYGLLGGRRNIFHQDINDIIKELAIMVTPTLVILDGTTTMMTNGPTGGSLSDLKATNKMIISTDQVAADAYGATLLGRQPSDLPYIIKAAAAGVGTASYEMLGPQRVTVG